MVSISGIEEIARANGAPLCGAAKTEDLSGNVEEIGKILPGVRSVVVLAAPHSRSAIESADVQMAQYDTVHAYGEAARASHAVVRWLEQRGHRTVAVPAFIPIDMAPPKLGMKGAVDWREAGVRARIGGYGESGLLVTREFGPAVRVGGVGNYYYCFACQAACPVGKTTRA
jgi:epoxyqueuosine reductase QueG